MLRSPTHHNSVGPHIKETPPVAGSLLERTTDYLRTGALADAVGALSLLYMPSITSA